MAVSLAHANQLPLPRL